MYNITLNKKIISVLATSFIFISGTFSEPVLRSELKPSDTKKPAGRPSVAVVMSGGGARGFVHIPILQTLDELDIPVDMVIGTSISSIIGGLYAAGYPPKEMFEVMSNTNWTPLFADKTVSEYEATLEEHAVDANAFSTTLDWRLKPKLGSGLVNGQGVYNLIRELTIKHSSDSNFFKLQTAFAAVAVDTLSGDTYVFKDGDIAEAIRSSMSIPGVFSPFKIGAHSFIDGGTSDNLPIDVAKKLGYDIIIAIDISQKIRDDPRMYEGSPTAALLNSITIPQRQTVDAMLKDATLVITPDTSGYGILTFSKAKEIYDTGKKCADEYREQFLELRKKIFPSDYDSRGNRISGERLSPKKPGYENLPYGVFTSYALRNQLPSDTKYFEKTVEKYVGKTFTPQAYEEIVRKMYATGNYKRILPRFLSATAEKTLEIEFEAAETNVAKIFIDTDLETSLGSRRMTRFMLSPEIQYRGLTGPGSVLALRGTFVNLIAGDIHYFMPFTQNLFIETSGSYLGDRYPTSAKAKTGGSIIRESSEWRLFFNLGTRTRNDSTVKAGAFFAMNRPGDYSFTDDPKLYFNVFHNEDDAFDGSDEWFKTAGLNIEIMGNTLDSGVFAQKGLYAKLNGKLMIPLDHDDGNGIKPVYQVSIDMQQALPLGKKCSLVFNEFAGFDILERMDGAVSTLITDGFTNYDRIYFPQTTSPERHGLHKIAAAASLQMKLGDSLTIL